MDGDSWSLIALIGACWAEYPGCITDIAGEYPELLAPAQSFDRLGGRLWVLPEGAWIAASVGLCPGHDDPVELVKLYVAPHRRGRGLGATLVHWIEAQAAGATPASNCGATPDSWPPTASTSDWATPQRAPHAT